MRIIQIMPGKVWGGAEQYVLDLSKALANRGHEVTIIIRRSEAVKNRLKGEIPFKVMPFSGSFDLRAALFLAKMLKEKDADVLHIHATQFVNMAALAKKTAGSEVRIVLTRHIARKSWVFFPLRPAYKKLHKMIFVSRLAQNLWLEANAWMPKERCVVVHNSIPKSAETDAQTSIRRHLCIGKDVPLLMFTGRIRRSKGCAVTIEALALLRHLPFHIVFIGKCKPKSYAAKLLGIADKAGLTGRVTMYGFSNNVRSLIREADIGLAPSIVREACPLSPMEFMQAGKCVITTNNGAQPEYINDGKTGLLVKPNDAHQLAEAIASVIKNPDKRRRIAASAQRYFDENMSYEAFIDKVIAAYS